MFDYILKALDSPFSTILYGSLGRYPNLLAFYLDAISELESVSEYELMFRYRKKSINRIVYFLLEPSFDEFIPPGTIALSSHLRLRYNPLTTQIIKCNYPLERDIPFPIKACVDHERIIPPTNHSMQFLTHKPLRVDLTSVENTHEAYLRLLTLYDSLQPSSKWSLSISEKLRLRLLKDIPGTGPYDSLLLKVLE